MKPIRYTLLSAALWLLCNVAGAQQPEAKLSFDIHAQPMEQALNEFAQKTGLQLIFPAGEIAADIEAPALVGSYTPRDALRHLLANSSLSYEFVNARTVSISSTKSSESSPQRASIGAAEGQYRPLVLAQADPPAGNAQNAGEANAGTESGNDSEELQEITVDIPEILVSGSKILNMDIKRSRDDAQPYVIFNRETIERSGASNVEEFLNQRLTMNTQRFSFAQASGGDGTRSQISLRGLGKDETLVLIDGRRAVSEFTGGGLQQPNINGIPLAAIERIEVLAATASGIYGGSATGGVVNVVLRRDYSGAELTTSYDNSFDGDSSVQRVGLNAGFDLEEGKTNVLLAGHYSDTNPLTYGDRDLLQRARRHILANNPSGLLLFGFFPPLGATPNIMSLDGSPLFGPGTSNFTSVPVGYAGGGGLAPLQTNAGVFNLDPANSAQSFSAESPLLVGSLVKSGSLTVRRRFSENFQAFLDLGASDTRSRSALNGTVSGYIISSSAPNNPFGQDILVTVPVADADEALPTTQTDRKLSAGVIFRLPHRWQGEMDYVWNRAKHDWVFPNGLDGSEAIAIGDGSLDVLRDTNAFPLGLTNLLPASRTEPVRSTLQDTALRLAGPVGHLPGGAVTLSGLLEHRDETFDESIAFTPFGDFLTPESSQKVYSAYLEAKLPLVSPANPVAGVEELELQLAGRWDEYRIDAVSRSVLVGSPIERTRNELSSVNPTIGLRYVPVQGLMLRVSYGTGFLPPKLDELLRAPGPLGTGVFPGEFCDAGSVVDPRRGNVVTPLEGCLIGGNGDLQPEESESWSAGIVLTPAFAPALRFSVDYTRIDKTDNIINQFPIQKMVDNEALFPGRVFRDDPAPGETVGPITIVDSTALNIAQAHVEAFDVSMDYRHETARHGAFDFFALATWQTDFETKLLPAEPFVEEVGIGTAPVKLKGNAGVTWRYGHWTLGWTARYFDSYLVGTDPIALLTQGNGGRVPSQSYHDLAGSYKFDSGITGMTWLKQAEIGFGIKNIFDKKPPVEMQSTSFSYYSTLGDPRLASYYLSLRISF